MKRSHDNPISGSVQKCHNKTLISSRIGERIVTDDFHFLQVKSSPLAQKLKLLGKNGIIVFERVHLFDKSGKRYTRMRAAGKFAESLKTPVIFIYKIRKYNEPAKKYNYKKNQHRLHLSQMSKVCIRDCSGFTM